MAKLVGIRQPHVSDLVRYRLNRFSVDRLLDFLTRLGKDVQIRIAARPSGRRRSAVHVHYVGWKPTRAGPRRLDDRLAV